MGDVDESWTNKELRAECKLGGISGYSGLNKASLLQTLNTGRVASGDGSGAGRKNKSVAKLTVAELRDECRRQGLRNFGRLRKDELISLLRDEEGGVSQDTKSGDSEKFRKPTVAELRAECRDRGITGFWSLNRADLLQRLEEEEAKTVDLGARKAKEGRPILRTEGAKQVEQQELQRERMRGPLRSTAQTRFEAGPLPSDTPGFLYIYYEPGNGSNSSGRSSADAIEEWKIGKTTMDPPERRMRQSAQKNNKVYKLRASWYVPWCGYVEKIVHRDLKDFRMVPGKMNSREQGGGIENGGTEWFRANIDVIEARVNLVIRMVAAREAGEAELKGVPAFSGMFRCGLPRRRSSTSV